MSIKLVLLSTGDTIISDAKEVLSENKDIQGYLLENPLKVSIRKDIFISDDPFSLEDSNREVQITMSSWAILTNDKEFFVTPNWVVTIMEPLASVKEMYEERIYGKSS
jgi:hypothetical protein